MQRLPQLIGGTAATAAVLFSLGIAAPIAAAAPVVPAALASEGVRLAPEEVGATAIVTSAPGEKVEFTVRPKDCQSNACGTRVSFDGGPALSPANAVGSGPRTGASAASLTRKSIVSPLNGATVSNVKRIVAQTGLAQRAAVGGWTWDDRLCFAGSYGCSGWTMVLHSTTWYDQSYAWGTRSRLGKVGAVNCDVSAGHGTWSAPRWSFVNDPHPSLLYATCDAVVAAFGGSASHYVHRHTDKSGGTWGVTN